MKDIRVVLRKKKTYKTASNKIRIVKTPGNKLVVQKKIKKSKGPRLQLQERTKIQGVKRLNPRQLKKLKKKHRTISRPYGGVFSHIDLKNKIMNALFKEF